MQQQQRPGKGKKSVGNHLVMGRRADDGKLILSFLQRIDKKSKEMQRALRAIRNATICQNPVDAIGSVDNVGDNDGDPSSKKDAKSSTRYGKSTTKAMSRQPAAATKRPTPALSTMMSTTARRRGEKKSSVSTTTTSRTMMTTTPTTTPVTTTTQATTTTTRATTTPTRSRWLTTPKPVASSTVGRAPRRGGKDGSKSPSTIATSRSSERHYVTTTSRSAGQLSPTTPPRSSSKGSDRDRGKNKNVKGKREDGRPETDSG